MNRTTDVAVNTDERIHALKAAKPDMCIAIHHNSISGYPNWGGFECFYYSPWSKLVTEKVFENTKDTGVYNKHEMRWHNYFVARQTCCPVVLTENGYVTNLYDLNNTVSQQAITQKAVIPQ